MSSEKKKSAAKKAGGGLGRKSGMLTGLVMISLGLVAGYHGLGMAFDGKASRESNAQAGTVTTAALGSQQTADDRRDASPRAHTIADLINEAGSLEELARPVSRPEYHDKTANPAPMVNRALKADFAHALDVANAPGAAADAADAAGESLADADSGTLADARRPAMIGGDEPVENAPYTDDEVFAKNGDEADLWINRALARNAGELAPSSNAQAMNAQAMTEQAGRAAKTAKMAGKTAPMAQKSASSALAAANALNADTPVADAADIALFAADMPLPSGLGKSFRAGSMAGSSSASGALMRPRLYASGKTFGGLAEREFQRRERRCLVTALYFEARSEPLDGQIAVGQVIMNRVKSPDYPDTICGVVYQGSHRRTGCQFSFTCDGKPDKPRSRKMWERSKRIADQVLEGKVWLRSIGNATHYHADYVSPKWRWKMSRLSKIGRHIFYKSPNISVTASFQRMANGKRG
jgi:spore germination cell wall hydrolase CwlJ-like protein